MDYQTLKLAYDTYSRGENVTSALRTALAVPHNTPEIVEIAYDLQAGSFVRFAKDHAEPYRAYTTELAEILAQHVADFDSLLDVGTGEMTSLTPVLDRLSHARESYACDISWSRIHVGRRFAQRTLPPGILSNLGYCVADMFHLPFLDSSVDVVWTSHALEPNGGREREAVKELCRVARKKVILFEPYYEAALPEGKRRMEQHGYVRGLRDAAKSEGAILEDVIKVEHAINPNNPTHAFVLTPSAKHLRGKDALEPWACPLSNTSLRMLSGFFYSEQSRLAYPIIDGIPMLRKEFAVLATALS